MRRLTLRRVALATALALSGTAGACAPKPIVARDPVPAPGPGFGYVCDSRPVVLNAYSTNCEPTMREPTAVLRAKG
ncbi:hypothetical protein [Methylobacterium sp. J-068]|uniref:hypothetical protein n=1 Tax=Methylobacterium sp. J-068 TaxID=2836649 RepID=UPI001FB990C3|nr:hypothetical protein [Methylobacterium sp. J-068]MCJ2037210.1 hypothetical protein [Methylobacterium sp. J-068]